jgi:sugar phosphate isomerase/epimerase
MTKPISLQLYSLREALKEDFAGIIEQVAATGYVGVEPFGGISVPHNEAAKIFAANGLQVESSHLSLPEGENEKPGLDAAAAYGLKYYCIPWQPPTEFESTDSIKALADRMNAANKLVQAAGMRMLYHNHEFEFAQVDGKTGYEIFLDALDPSIGVEVDTYWVEVAGHSSADLVTQLGARAPLLHIKDGPANADDRNAPMTAVGQGRLDIPAIARAGDAHAEWLVVELDHCATDMLTAVKDSFTYLTEGGLAHGKG